MDNIKVGRLIFQLRKEKGLTQQQLADKLDISNKTVSKWECGNGAPDVSTWERLSKVLDADIANLLQGALNPNRPDPGRMDKIRFYVCPACHNIMTSTGKADISCCGRKIEPLQPIFNDKSHKILVQELDDGYFISLQHEMSKSHYISFVSYVLDSNIWFQRLYPEQDASLLIPFMRKEGKIYWHCSRHGLFCHKLKV